MDRILIYGGDADILRALREEGVERHIEIENVSDFQGLLTAVRPKGYDAAFIHINDRLEEGAVTGVEIIQVLKKLDPRLPIVVITEGCSFETERKARVAGVFFYMLKPLNAQEVRSVLDEIVHKPS